MKIDKEKCKNWLKLDLKILLILACYYTLTYFLHTTCLFKFITGIECPTCGTTRAMICLLKLDFKGYVKYNYLAFPSVFLIYFCLHLDKGKVKNVFETLLVIDAVCLFVKYIFL